MKQTSVKLGLLSLLAFSSFVFGQAQEKTSGAVGINIGKPQATLDIKAFDETGSSVEGVLIPRVDAARAGRMGENVADATLLYITDGVAGTGTISAVNGKGFYYFDASAKKWTKVGGESTAATAATPNWEQIKYGTKGKVVLTENDQLVPKDTWLVIGSGSINPVRLPEMKPEDAGRMIIVFKQDSGNLDVTDYNGKVAGEDKTVMKTVSSVSANRGRTFIWDGQYWRTINY